jgi:hypothetical protein
MSEKQIKKIPPKQHDLPMASPDNGHLINPTIVQILIEGNKPEEVMELMRAELDYNRERLEIVRDHAEKHPDYKDDRRNKQFRRAQYTFLMLYVLISSGILITHKPQLA